MSNRPIRARNVHALFGPVPAVPPPSPAPLVGARARGPLVGAPPAIVSLGLPGARDEVRAYADRIQRAWTEFWESDFAPWNASRVAGEKKAIVMGEVIGGSPAERAMIEKVTKDFTAFGAYRTSLASFDLLGPTASEAWQTLFSHEKALKADRALFAKVTAPRALVSPDPLELEKPGGVDPGDAGGTGGLSIFGGIPAWGWAAGAAVVVVGGVLAFRR